MPRLLEGGCGNRPTMVNCLQNMPAEALIWSPDSRIGKPIFSRVWPTDCTTSCRIRKPRWPRRFSTTTTAPCRPRNWSSASRWTSTARPWPICASPSSGGPARQDPRLQPADRAAWLAVDPYRGRGGHRRHAVPGRFGEHGAERAWPLHPPHDPSRDPGPARCRRRCSRRSWRLTGRVPRRSPKCFMHFEIDQQSDPERLEAIRASLERVMGDVRAAVRGLARHARPGIEPALADLKRGAKAADPDEVAEVEAFLRWIADDNFTFLGYTCYDLLREKDGDCSCAAWKARALGLLRRQAELSPSANSRSFAALPADVRRLARRSRAAGHHQGQHPLDRAPPGLSRLHRRQALRQQRAGCWASTASSACSRPPPTTAIRATSRCCAARSSGSSRAPISPPASHAGKALANILETYPRDELFQVGDDELFETVMRDPAPAGAPAHPAVRPARRVRALRLLPGLRAARSLGHCFAAQVPGHPPAGASTAPRSTSRRSSRNRSWRACSSSCARPTACRATSTSRSSSGSWSRRRAPGPTSCATR